MSQDRRGDHPTVALPPLVLIGAASKAGQAIARLWPGAIVAIHRGEGAGVTVADYRAVPAGVIREGSVVVNCVGTPHGSAELLREVNRNITIAWAQRSAAEGARAFVQLSSFSVYGAASLIDGRTAEAPESDYGWTKLETDHALAAMTTAAMPIAILRIPMLFGHGPDKLSKLVGLFTRLRSVPQPPRSVERAMLSYGALAEAIVHLGRAPISGVRHFADPQAFSYDLVADRMHRISQRPVRRIKIPRLATGLLRAAAPTLAARLFRSSVLADDLRMDCPLTPDARLLAALDRIVAGRGYASEGSAILR